MFLTRLAPHTYMYVYAMNPGPPNLAASCVMSKQSTSTWTCTLVDCLLNTRPYTCRLLTHHIYAYMHAMHAYCYIILYYITVKTEGLYLSGTVAAVGVQYCGMSASLPCAINLHAVNYLRWL